MPTAITRYDSTIGGPYSTGRYQAKQNHVCLPTSIFEGPHRPDLVRSVLSHYCAFERVLSSRNTQYSALKELNKGPGEYTRLCPFFKATYPTVSGPSDPKLSIWRYSGYKDWSRRLSPGFMSDATSIGFVLLAPSSRLPVIGTQSGDTHD